VDFCAFMRFASICDCVAINSSFDYTLIGSVWRKGGRDGWKLLKIQGKVYFVGE